MVTLCCSRLQDMQDQLQKPWNSGAAETGVQIVQLRTLFLGPFVKIKLYKEIFDLYIILHTHIVMASAVPRIYDKGDPPLLFSVLEENPR